MTIGSRSDIRTQYGLVVLVLLLPYHHVEFQRSRIFYSALNDITALEPTESEKEKLHYKIPNLLHVIITYW